MIALLLLIAALLVAVLYKLTAFQDSMTKAADQQLAILQGIARYGGRLAQPLYNKDAIDRMTEREERRYQAALKELDRKFSNEKE